MPRLKNIRHERFCQYRAKGNTQVRAYRLAGFTGSLNKASRIANRPDVKARLQEIMQYAERMHGHYYKIDIETLTARLVQICELAFENGDLEVGRKTTMDLAKLHGLFEERLRADLTGDAIREIKLVAGKKG